jgi:hypothetical protein
MLASNHDSGQSTNMTGKPARFLRTKTSQRACLWITLLTRQLIHGETVPPQQGETVPTFARKQGETVTPSYMYL